MPEEGWAMVRRRRFTGTSVCNIPNATVAFFPFMASTLPTVPWPSRRTLSSTRTGSLSAACRVFPLSFRRLGAFLAMHSLCRRCGAVLLFSSRSRRRASSVDSFSAWARFISWMVRSMAALLPSSIFRASSLASARISRRFSRSCSASSSYCARRLSIFSLSGEWPFSCFPSSACRGRCRVDTCRG